MQPKVQYKTFVSVVRGRKIVPVIRGIRVVRVIMVIRVIIRVHRLVLSPYPSLPCSPSP